MERRTARSDDPLKGVYAPPKDPSAGTDVGRTSDVLGTLALACPAAAGALSFFFARSWPTATLGAGTLLLATAITLMAVDARRRGAGSVASWVLGSILLFAVAFPLYMHRRVAWGAPRRLPHALVALGLYLFGNLYPALAHERARVSILCAPTSKQHADGADCVGTQTTGDVPVTACFDVTLTCGDGVVWSEHACVDSQPGGTGRAHVTPDIPTPCAHPKLGVVGTTVTAR